jgi:hypothetical protein
MAGKSGDFFVNKDMELSELNHKRSLEIWIFMNFERASKSDIVESSALKQS